MMATAPPADRLVLDVVPAEELAVATAAGIARTLQDCVAERGTAVLALSGGSTPVPMFRELFARTLAWDHITIVQVDERVAPAGHPDRNLTDLERERDGTPAARSRLESMPVEADDLDAGAARYADVLRTVAGDPPAIDVVQLGIGGDGHTASLVPGDDVLDVTDRDVAATGEYRGRRRLTLTYPAINRARHIVWMVGDTSKSAAVHGVVVCDQALPATRIRRRARMFIDADTARG